MPRMKRQYSEIKVYHVIFRGNDKQDIFLDDEDRKLFLKILLETIEKYEYEIYSYCLMDNHIHIVVYDKENQLSKIMQSIAIRYSKYFNKKYNRIGHLFQNRFLSKKVEESRYLLQLCRYIHRNPEKAGIQKINEYKWSSFQEYIKKPKIINPKMLLSIFSEDINVAKEEFIKFHNMNDVKEIYEDIEFEIKDKITDQQINKYICELLDISNVHEILEFSVQKRNEVLSKIKERHEIKNAQLARVIGINRKIVDRAK